jgi:hypothetical protein
MNALPWPPRGDEPVPDLNNQNVASGNAHVDQQVGLNLGDTTFHRYETTYNVNQADPPERKFEVALNHLSGGNSRIAEDCFRELLQQGHLSTKLAYHYALAALSGRSLSEIGESGFASFQNAARMASRFQPDGWNAALDVVWEFVSCVWQQDAGDTLDPEGLGKAIRDFRALPSKRQAEITRHLGMILGGAIQDSLDAIGAQGIAGERMKQDRVGRAWKFFEPAPARPRTFSAKAVKIGMGDWVRMWLGGVALALGLVTALSHFGNGSTGLAILALLLVAAGGSGAYRFGLERELQSRRLVSADREHGLPLRVEAAVSPGHWVSTSFVKQIHDRVEARFRDARPHIQGNWQTDTHGIREYLKRRFVKLYGNAQVEPEAVNWLIRWHAERVATQWRAGTLYSYRAALLPSSRTIGLFYLGAGAIILGCVMLAMAGSGLFIAAFFLALGAFFAVEGAVRIVATRRRAAEEDIARRRLAGEEDQAHGEWLRVLGNRPSDTEMARWLDLDKSYLKTQALRRCGLVNRDLVAHVVLTEGAVAAKRARVLHGPVRYSAYVVLVFLLTKSGVREVEVDLDFLGGTVHNERRTSFRYDALAAARVAEVGVRYANDRRYFVRAEDSVQFMDVHTLRSRAFRLSLLSGEDITVVMESFNGLTDTNVENESELRQIALESSGIAGALHVLEAVAAEGRDWITQEQERGKRRSQDWRDDSDRLTLLGPDFVAPFGQDDQDLDTDDDGR